MKNAKPLIFLFLGVAIVGNLLVAYMKMKNNVWVPAGSMAGTIQSCVVHPEKADECILKFEDGSVGTIQVKQPETLDKGASVIVLVEVHKQNTTRKRYSLPHP